MSLKPPYPPSPLSGAALGLVSKVITASEALLVKVSATGREADPKSVSKGNFNVERAWWANCSPSRLLINDSV